MEKRNYKTMKNFGGISRLVSWNSPRRDFIENGSVGAPLKKGHVFSEADVLRDEINHKIKTAKNYEDLNSIGSSLAYAKDHNLEVGLFDCTYRASKKMREIYNKIGEYREE